VVLADEPTASLDTERAFQVVETFANLIHEQNRAGIMVTHDLRLTQYVDRVVQMRDGQIAEAADHRAAIAEQVVKHADDHHLEGIRIRSAMMPQPVMG
jgi:putative ABC transport system ATP-binding protein